MLSRATDKEIAIRLGRTTSQISYSGKSIVGKFGAKNRVHAVARLFAAVADFVEKGVATEHGGR
jgi:DNA-binding CsgD family transcriptional regulator